MKVGTDGVLLGASTPLNEANNILDIGTGTGVIAIMLAQRSLQKVHIEAIEIDISAYQQSVENITNSPWKSQITTYHTSIQNFTKEARRQYDLIVSNPPFFLQGSKPLEEGRINARHTDSLTHEELIKCSALLLKESGLLSIILPTKEGNDFIQLARSSELYCSQYIEVRPKADKPVERLLLSFSKSKSKVCIKKELTIQYERRNDYTPEYITLTKEFYTIM